MQKTTFLTLETNAFALITDEKRQRPRKTHDRREAWAIFAQIVSCKVVLTQNAIAQFDSLGTADSTTAQLVVHRMRTLYASSCKTPNNLNIPTSHLETLADFATCSVILH